MGPRLQRCHAASRRDPRRRHPDAESGSVGDQRGRESRTGAGRGCLNAAGLRRLVDVRPEEAGALAWAFVYFFCLLSSYYILRPLRDEMGVAAGVSNLQWLFTATFVVMLAAVPVFGSLVAR